MPSKKFRYGKFEIIKIPLERKRRSEEAIFYVALGNSREDRENNFEGENWQEDSEKSQKHLF